MTLRKLSQIAERDRPVASERTTLKITSVAQLKSYGIRMIKALKEDLAKIQNEYISRVNGNIDEYLAGKEETKLMTEEQLRALVSKLSQQLLQLSSNDLYLGNLGSQIDAIREAFEFCDSDLASQCFQTSGERRSSSQKQLQSQFLQVVQDQLDSIVKAAA